MFDTTALRDELQTLKGDQSRLVSATGDELFNETRSRGEALAGQIRAALDELRDTLEQREEHFEKIVSDRPIASLASAFALGIVVGLMLRKP
jgi:ElaB/YqjD/DUF883 family membrane-anchored ribosome-binding protein